MSAHAHHLLRTAVYNRFSEWRLRLDMDYANLGPMLLMQLCERDEHFHPHRKMTEADVIVCNNLLSEHGYTYCRALMAVRGIKHG